MTPQGHPRSNLMLPIESLWVIHVSAPVVQPRICHHFEDISNKRIVTLTYNLSSKSMTLIYDPSRSNLMVPIESPWVLRISALTVRPCICHHFRDISSENVDVDPLTLVRLTSGPKFTKREDDLLPSKSTIMQNFSPIAQTVYKTCVTKAFQLLAIAG